MALLKTKTGVKPANLIILCAIANVVQTLQEPAEVVITSANDSQHMVGSKHYSGEALDIRTKSFANHTAKQSFLDAVLKRLGKGDQGFIENEGKDSEHIHVELDPK